jgi:hypothetical protein
MSIWVKLNMLPISRYARPGSALLMAPVQSYVAYRTAHLRRKEQNASMSIDRSQRVDESGHRGVTDRADYLIDRFRVHYEFGGGWTCRCADFAASDACRHTREGTGRYIAQTLIAAHVKAGAPRTLTFDNSGAVQRAHP